MKPMVKTEFSLVIIYIYIKCLMYIFSLDVHIYSYDRIFMGFFFEGLKDFL